MLFKIHLCHVAVPTFCLEIHVGGVFVNEPVSNYSRGTTVTEYGCDSETFSMRELDGILTKLGYKDICKLHYKIPRKPLGVGLRLLHNEESIAEMLSHLKGDGATILVFAEHHNRVDGSTEGDEGLHQNEPCDEDIGSDCSSLRDELESEDEEACEAREKVKEHKAKKKVAGVVAEPDFSGVVEEGGIGVPLSDEEGEEPRVEDLDNEVDSGGETEYADTSDYDSPIDGEEDGELLRTKTQWPVFDPSNDFFKMEPILGMKFASFEELKDFIRCYAVHKGKQLKFSTNTNKKLHVKCVKGCPWRLWSSKMQKEMSVQIKSYRGTHRNCLRTCEPKIANSKFLSWLYKDKIYENPSWKLREFRKDVAERYKLKVSLIQCYRAKKKALSEVEFSLKEHYKKLWDYVGEMKSSNPDSTIKITVDRPILDKLPLFKRLYVCMDSCKKGFLEGCRPVLSLDGYFLKGFCKGELLVAIARDGNNQMFPLAWGQVEVENKSSWTWFLNLLKDDLILGQGAGYTIITDQQKGLVPAIVECLPLSEHRMCARHIYANFRKVYPGSQMKALFWAAAKSGTEQGYEHALSQIRDIRVAAADHLMAGPTHAWARAFFQVVKLWITIWQRHSTTLSLRQGKSLLLICSRTLGFM